MRNFFRTSHQRNLWLASAMTLLAVGFFIADLLLPLGIAAGVTYALVVLLAGWLRWRRAILVTALAASVLVGVGFLLSPATPEPWKALLNRGLSLFAIWAIAILLAQHRRMSDALEAANARLEHRATDREARLTGVLRYVVEAVIIIDEHGVIESINEAAGSIFEYSPAELCGKNVSLLMPEPYRSARDEYISAYRESGKRRIIDGGAREVEGITRSGATVPLELSVGRMDVDGRLMFIAVARDITRRKKAQAQLQHAHKMEALGQLTSGVAHDFNNLLTVILGNLEIAEDDIAPDSPVSECLDAARDAGKRAANLTSRLLAFSRKQILTPENVDINELVTYTAELLHRTLGAQIQIEMVRGAGAWHTFVDKGQLEDCLLNLAINARDAMPGGGKLTIETANSMLSREYAGAHEEVRPGQYVMIAVSDTGIGIPEEILDRIFDPFFTTKKQGEGTGLGLSMIYGFVKQSGGHIKAYSEPGTGTTMKVYLPRNDRNSTSRKETSAPASRAHPRGNETILVVEDDTAVRRFVIDTLEALGYTVFAAEDGPAAIELIGSILRLDLLVTDVILPRGMNGRQVADEILMARPDARILFMSGYTENAIVHHGILDQGVELLMKPYTREQLAETVRVLLDEGRV